MIPWVVHSRFLKLAEEGSIDIIYNIITLSY